MKNYRLDPPSKKRNWATPKACDCKRPNNTGSLVLWGVVVLYTLGMSVGLGLMIGNTNDRVLQLEHEAQTTWAVAKDSMEKLANLCTHFKVGCTEKYTGGKWHPRGH